MLQEDCSGEGDMKMLDFQAKKTEPVDCCVDWEHEADSSDGGPQMSS